MHSSLIKPLILYCSVTWTSCCSHDNISKIFRLQNRCARIVLDAQQRYSTVDLFNTLGWVPYCIETDIKRCTIVHKRIMGARPLYINDLLRLNNSEHNRNTRGVNFTILPTRWKRSVWQNPDQERTNHNARIYLGTTLPYNSKEHSIESRFPTSPDK